MPKRMGCEVIDAFYENRKPHWTVFETRQLLAVKIICLAISVGRASWLLINEYQVESKAVLENTWISNTVTAQC